MTARTGRGGVTGAEEVMRLGDVCAGIGGFSLAASRVGIDIGFQIEIDPWCQRVLAKHWPDVPRYGDIREVDPRALPAIDILSAGFPCQPVSNAGKRLGEADPRWLWPDVARCIRVLRPDWVLLENVPGLRSKGLGTVLGDLAACGYDAEWNSIPASVLGAPHQRERVFLVAYPGGVAGERRVFYDRPYDVSRDAQWRATQGIQSGRGWKRWLVQIASDMDWQDATGTVLGVDDGLPGELDRIRGLGNAIVPQVAELILRRIVAAEQAVPA